MNERLKQLKALEKPTIIVLVSFVAFIIHINFSSAHVGRYFIPHSLDIFDGYQKISDQGQYRDLERLYNEYITSQRREEKIKLGKELAWRYENYVDKTPNTDFAIGIALVYCKLINRNDSCGSAGDGVDYIIRSAEGGHEKAAIFILTQEEEMRNNGISKYRVKKIVCSLPEEKKNIIITLSNTKISCVER